MTSNKTEVITKIIATKMINSNPRIARGESSDINMEKENFINLVKDFIKLHIEEINENYVKIADTLIHDFSIIKDDKDIELKVVTEVPMVIHEYNNFELEEAITEILSGNMSDEKYNDILSKVSHDEYSVSRVKCTSLSEYLTSFNNSVLKCESFSAFLKRQASRLIYSVKAIEYVDTNIEFTLYVKVVTELMDRFNKANALIRNHTMIFVKTADALISLFDD